MPPSWYENVRDEPETVQDVEFYDVGDNDETAITMEPATVASMADVLKLLFSRITLPNGVLSGLRPASSSGESQLEMSTEEERLHKHAKEEAAHKVRGIRLPVL
eukprot:GHVT01030905.1.p2 GENE.GHVT01030905.1~~GHVT01030905.1.p2  ORF type:complete len:104 (-),score=13.36 GHVT01030905.1:413-724(-)